MTCLSLWILFYEIAMIDWYKYEYESKNKLQNSQHSNWLALLSACTRTVIVKIRTCAWSNMFALRVLILKAVLTRKLFPIQFGEIVFFLLVAAVTLYHLLNVAVAEKRRKKKKFTLLGFEAVIIHTHCALLSYWMGKLGDVKVPEGPWRLLPHVFTVNTRK